MRKIFYLCSFMFLKIHTQLASRYLCITLNYILLHLTYKHLVGQLGADKLSSDGRNWYHQERVCSRPWGGSAAWQSRHSQSHHHCYSPTKVGKHTNIKYIFFLFHSYWNLNNGNTQFPKIIFKQSSFYARAGWADATWELGALRKKGI